MAVSNNSFRSFCETLVVVSQLICSTLGGIIFTVDEFFGLIFSISFTISHKETYLNKNLF